MNRDISAFSIIALSICVPVFIFSLLYAIFSDREWEREAGIVLAITSGFCFGLLWWSW